MSPALYLIDTSGLFRILQSELRKAWSDHLAAGVIAICPIVGLEFLFSARSLADRLEKQQLLHDLFGWVPMPERHTSARQKSSNCSPKLGRTGRRARLTCSSPPRRSASDLSCSAMIVIS